MPGGVMGREIVRRNAWWMQQLPFGELYCIHIYVIANLVVVFNLKPAFSSFISRLIDAVL
jgi:hypothetical protein